MPLISRVMRHTSMFCLSWGVQSLHWNCRRRDPFWVDGYAIDIEIEWFCDVLWGFYVGYPIKSSYFITFLPFRISTALFFFCIIINKLKFFNLISQAKLSSLIILYIYVYSFNKKWFYSQCIFHSLLKVTIKKQSTTKLVN